MLSPLSVVDYPGNLRSGEEHHSEEERVAFVPRDKINELKP